MQRRLLGRFALGQWQEQPTADGRGLGTPRTWTQVVGEQMGTQRACTGKLDQQRRLGGTEREHKGFGLLHDAA